MADPSVGGAPERPRRRRIGWALLWALTLGLGSVFAWIAVSGIRRDHRTGEPVIPLPLHQTTGWTEQSFRVWGPGHWRLILSAVAFDSTHVDTPLAATIEVRLLAPGGRVVRERTWAAGETGLTLPWNYGDAKLDSLTLDDSPFRRWTLAARVTNPDPRFAGADAELKLWRDRYDPGMGGLITYVLIVPAGLLLVVSCLAAIPLLREPRGRRLPLALSLALFLAFLFFMR